MQTAPEKTGRPTVASSRTAATLDNATGDMSYLGYTTPGANVHTAEPAMSQTSFIAHDERRRIAELETALAERDRRIAELEPLARLAVTLQRVALAEHWPARDKAILAALLAKCQADPAAGAGADRGAAFAELELSAADVARLAGVGERTARDALARFDAAGVVRRRVEREAVNRYGDSVPAYAADPARGDRWQTYSTLSLPLDLPELPALPDTAYLTRARTAQRTERAAVVADRAKLAELREIVAGLRCPHCGETGDWHVTCGSCGARLELADDDAAGAGEAVETGPVNFTAPPPAPDRQADRQNWPTPAPDDPGPVNFTAYMSDAANFADLAPSTEGKAGVMSAADPGSAPVKFTAPENAADSPPAPAAEDRAEIERRARHAEYVAWSAHIDTLIAEDRRRMRGMAAAAAPVTAPTCPAPPAAYLTGRDTVAWLADLPGAAFALAHPRSKVHINPPPADDDLGMPIPWPECPLPAAAALAHVARGGNVAYMPAGQVLVDCDDGLPDLAQAWPELVEAPAAYHPDAPNRAKFILRLDGPLPDRRKYTAPGRVVEVLTDGMVAGTHPSGAEYRFLPGQVPTVTAAELDARLTAFIALPPAPELDPDRVIEPPARPPKPALSSVPARPNATAGQAANHAGDVHARILEWCADPANQAAVDTLLDGCKRAGKFYAIRPTDTTPSTTRRTDHDGRRIWRDFGAGVTYDDFDLWCMLTGTDKRQAIRDMVAT